MDGKERKTSKKSEAGKWSASWFFNWVINSRFAIAMLVILLISLIILVLSKMRWIFSPLTIVLNTIALPVIIAGVFYYILNPLVDWAEKKYHIKRSLIVTIVFIVLALFIAWGIGSLIPVVQSQTQDLLANWPDYWSKLENFVVGLFSADGLKDLQNKLSTVNTDLGEIFKPSKAVNFLPKSLNSIGSILSRVTSVIISIVTAPLILFYLLKDGHDLPDYLVGFLPNRYRLSVKDIFKNMNSQLSNYIRGQLGVAFFVAVLFWIGYMIIGLRFALLLGIIAGLLNLIPYLGSFLAMVPAIAVGLFTSPFMLVKVLIVFVIEQTLEGRLISPLILGNSMKFHPLTVLFVLLVSGKIFGLVGVILGVPGYAVIKVVVSTYFDWFKRSHPDLYVTEHTSLHDISSDEEEQ
ncbi:AI-2E family transporter [Ligilactobacillus acidipiscis]|jgi:predicted PurR-regulated permease PerM|uniref:AI-2E family transporter n=1 Tax=Ligilactobacillus acidipiscis TaxID=89059 RepID=A0A921K1I9_9LACO|nr:AI-2E family transporter [Ligilactobacillus acidipiscis]MCI1954276.1 AI-2E family transporter [Ligilactobacillus acidipiscis]WEV57297.1 AI-2E family transporter [Ligilactobacillus acidipiscis]HJE98093.1 AI-2E family transporter [Ligilactobacillus acidipiscis]